MTIIIDKRKNTKGQSTPNRKKFLDRYKRAIKTKVEEIADNATIKGAVDEYDINIGSDEITEPTFSHDQNEGERKHVLPGNKELERGDRIRKGGSSDEQGRGGSSGGEGMDEFTFTLTKEEFLELYFGDLQLPNFIKEGLKLNSTMKKQRAGYSRDGIPSQLNLKKTFEQAFGRRIATRAQGKKPRYLDDVDLRYNYFANRPVMAKHAVMFCLMDVSGSMQEFEKTVAKKFYILLYLFLEKEYDNIDIIFIRHTHEAHEVDEYTFFHSRETGGTVVSTGLLLIDAIIKERYDVATTNIYVAQASDGDNWSDDMELTVNALEDLILPQVQYYIYMQINEHEPGEYDLDCSLYNRYQPLAEEYKHFVTKQVHGASEIYNLFRELFGEYDTI